MPTFTIRPDGLLTPGSGDWVGFYTDIDEPVDTHDGDGTYLQFNSVGSPDNGPVFSLSDPPQQSGDPTTRQWTSAKIRIVVKQESESSSAELMVSLGHPQANVPRGFLNVSVNGTINNAGNYKVYQAEITAQSALTNWSGAGNGQLAWTWNEISNFRLSFFRDSPLIVQGDFHFTAVEIILTLEDSGGGGDESLVDYDEVVFDDAWSVSGPSASTSNSWLDEAIFSDAWSIERMSSGGDDGGGDGDVDPDPDIVPGPGNDPPARTDTACRSCGSMAQVNESLIFYADGFAQPVTWDGVSPLATTVLGAKLLPYVAAHRDRVWLFGDEPYVTGTVATFGGIAQIQFSAAPPTSVLGKTIAISEVTFGDDERCMATITALNGVQATLSQPPNQNFTANNFIIFSGTAGATLQWSDENDHTTWTDPELPVGRLDGDIPTGVASVAGFLMLFKRQKTYRFDYGFDPNDLNDRALVVNSETRGLVAHRSCVVVEGSAYCMDQFGSGDGEAGWWVTRGGALFPIEFGGDISDVTSEGGPYQLDWSKSSCWFGVYEPRSNSIWWFCTKLGDNLPKIAFVYNRPAAEGGDEPGRWMVAEFDHPCIMGVTAVGGDGVMRAYVACADPDNEESIYLSALGNKYGDMATSSQNGVVRKKISNNVLDLGKHTELHMGSLVEINGVRRTVAVDDTVQVTFTDSWELTDVENKAWRAGWKPTVTFKTIYISPDPGYTQTTVDQCHALFIRDNPNAELRIGFESDGNTQWFSVLGGAVDPSGTFANYERLVSMNIGVSGYEISLIIQMFSPGGGNDMIHSVDILRHKRSESSSGYPSEMP